MLKALSRLTHRHHWEVLRDEDGKYVEHGVVFKGNSMSENGLLPSPICAMRHCVSCGRYEVTRLRDGRPWDERWRRVVGFTHEETETPIALLEIDEEHDVGIALGVPAGQPIIEQQPDDRQLTQFLLGFVVGGAFVNLLYNLVAGWIAAWGLLVAGALGLYISWRAR